jgi:predicted PhzF superfamily epimerase YddE/YHI9
MAEPDVVRVFVDEDGRWGNPLGVFLGAEAMEIDRRQRIAAELGFSETVFVEDREASRLRIHTPEVELPFAGHPCVGTAWLLAREGTPPAVLRPPAGEVRVRFEGKLTWISARPEWCPRFELRRLATPAEVDALEAPEHERNVYAWAWIDERAGTVRARCFVPEAGIIEDEATGSAALALAAELDRSLDIHQGRGSRLFARPGDDGGAEVGGRCSG